MTINPRWFPAEVKQSDAEAKARYEQMIRGGATAFRRLKEIINQEVASLQKPRNDVDYEHGWQYKQADRLGQLRAYQSILTLLEFVNDQNSKSRK